MPEAGASCDLTLRYSINPAGFCQSQPTIRTRLQYILDTFRSHNASYGFSTGRHGSASHCTCALILVLNPRIPGHTNCVIFSQIIFAIPSPSRPFPRGVHFNEVEPGNITPWVEQYCITSVHSLCFYRANRLTLNRFRDDQSQRTLTSIMTTSQSMTVGLCLNTCYENYLSYAGLENGNECCECLP